MTRRAVWLDRAEVLFQSLFLIVGFLQYSSLTADLKIISYVQWPTLALGGVLVLLRLWRWKCYVKTPGLWLLLAFALSYAISSVVNLKYGWYENFRFLVFLGFQIVLLFPYDGSRELSSAFSRWEKAGWLFLAGTGLLSLLSFVFFFAGYVKIMKQENGPYYHIGFANGRLFGAYWDPNIAAVMAVMASVLAFYFILKYRALWLRILLGISIFLQLMYIEFSDSRTGKVCLAVAVLVAGYLCMLRRNRDMKAWRQHLLACVVAVATAVVVLLTVTAGGKLYNAVVAAAGPSSSQSQVGDKELGREGDVASDVSNRRFDIWESAFDLFKTTPVVGTSHGNIVPYAEENLPDTYILTNDHMVFYTMHNVFVDVMVSQGAVGLLLFLSAGVWIFAAILRRMRALLYGEHGYAVALAFAIAVTAVASSLFMTELVYVITPLTLLFWISVGALAHAASRTDR
ncbi:MAG: O-antigen ligase family protein [Clostridia bacterium]|nr:O-antigen ligase family protein [Clostridia bacterium]